MSELYRAANPTTEEAIKYLEHMIFTQDFHPSTLRAKAVNTMAIEALREKAEREKGCEYCSQSSKSIDNGEVGVSKAILYLCAKSKRIHFMDAKGKLAIFDIKYCPMCGKRLEVKP